jgi:hypothetical protein
MSSRSGRRGSALVLLRSSPAPRKRASFCSARITRSRNCERRKPINVQYQIALCVVATIGYGCLLSSVSPPWRRGDRVSDAGRCALREGRESLPSAEAWVAPSAEFSVRTRYIWALDYGAGSVSFSPVLRRAQRASLCGSSQVDCGVNLNGWPAAGLPL